MGVTHAQRIAGMHEASAVGDAPADRAQSVYEFDDGWQVVRLVTAGDVRREGLLMRSCLARYAGDTLPETPGSPLQLGPRAHTDEVRPLSADDLEALEMPPRYLSLALYSLRDPMGLPHLTWWAQEGCYSIGVLGYRNCEPPAPYRQRFEVWAAQFDAPALTAFDELVYDHNNGADGQALIDRIMRVVGALYPGEGQPLGRRRHLKLNSWWDRLFPLYWELIVCRAAREHVTIVRTLNMVSLAGSEPRDLDGWALAAAEVGNCLHEGNLTGREHKAWQQVDAINAQIRRTLRERMQAFDRRRGRRRR